MLQQEIHVKDQFGVKHTIQATFEKHVLPTEFNTHIHHIIVEGEHIRPSFDMLFASSLTGKIFKII